MQRKYRLTRSTDFKRVRRFGKSYAHPLVVLITLPNERDAIRIGVTASRAVGNAVQRNRAKRLLREAARALLPRIRSGYDILLLGRAPILQVKTQDVQDALSALLLRAALLIPSDEK